MQSKKQESFANFLIFRLHTLVSSFIPSRVHLSFIADYTLLLSVHLNIYSSHLLFSSGTDSILISPLECAEGVGFNLIIRDKAPYSIHKTQHLLNSISLSKALG
jgi:hypothetical protein